MHLMKMDVKARPTYVDIFFPFMFQIIHPKQRRKQRCILFKARDFRAIYLLFNRGERVFTQKTQKFGELLKMDTLLPR